MSYGTSLSILRSVVDSERRLPSLEFSQAHTEAGHSMAAHDAYGMSIGTMRFADDENPEYQTITHSHVEDSFRGRGYGTMLYLGAAALAYDQNKRLRSDVLVTIDAARVWIRLQSHGVARIEQPFHWSDPAGHSDHGWAAFRPLDQLS